MGPFGGLDWRGGLRATHGGSDIRGRRLRRQVRLTVARSNNGMECSFISLPVFSPFFGVFVFGLLLTGYASDVFLRVHLVFLFCVRVMWCCATKQQNRLLICRGWEKKSHSP